MAADDFAGRLRRAILSYESQIGRRVPYRELAGLIAKQEGRAKPYATATVSEWVQGRSEPGLTTLRAIATVLRVDVALLAFGDPTQQVADPADDIAAFEQVAEAGRQLDERERRATERSAFRRVAGVRPITPKRPGKGKR